MTIYRTVPEKLTVTNLINLTTRRLMLMGTTPDHPIIQVSRARPGRRPPGPSWSDCILKSPVCIRRIFNSGGNSNYMGQRVPLPRRSFPQGLYLRVSLSLGQGVRPLVIYINGRYLDCCVSQAEGDWNVMCSRPVWHLETSSHILLS